MSDRGDDFGEPTSSRGAFITPSERKLVLLVTNVMSSGGILEIEVPPLCELTLGRAPTSDLRIDAPSVSRTHALFEIVDGRLTLRDLDSTNGTFVNGHRIGSDPVEIDVDDALRFGDVVGQLCSTRASRLLAKHLIEPREFDARVAEEAERCVRYDRSIAVIVVEATDDSAFSLARDNVLTNLRTLDVATTRGNNRIQILACECGKEEALAIAGRILAAPYGSRLKVGIAAYPGDVPSANSLLVAATVAMRGSEAGKIGEAQAGARVVHVGGHEVVVADPAVVRLFGMIERVAANKMPVLISGETGSGKEIVAETVHRWGPRGDRPLVKLNCAAVPENLLESELFGHEKGAFSGADRTKPGLFEEADGGTMFLDEIGDMSLPLQAKLLRLLEDQRVRRVGATRDKQIDVRIVAATHHDLRAAVDERRFRQDLFYRLSAIMLRVPPLRDRPREIPLLVEKFVAEACEEGGRDALVISPDTMVRLCAHRWPGNIRELRNVIGAAVMMCDGAEIQPHHLPPQVIGAEPPRTQRRTTQLPTVANAAPAALDDELRNLERDRIIEALTACDGNQTRAAEYLKMPRRTLVSKLAALGIERPRKRG